jgi:hypothetical protein
MNSIPFISMAIVGLLVGGCVAPRPSKEQKLVSYNEALKRCKGGEKKSWEDVPTCADRMSYTIAKEQCKAGKKQGGESLTDCARRTSGKGK